MTIEELYNKTLVEFKLEKIHPLHQAIMEECCENALSNVDDVKEEDLTNIVKIAFWASIETLRGTMRGALEAIDADQITLNYRGQSFIVKKDSQLLK